ncbi:MAG: translation initiation factor aIF-1A [Desulfurococcaceae archaeon]
MVIYMSKKKEKDRSESTVGSDIPLPGPGTVICGVVKHLGGDYLIANCTDGVNRKVRIPGRMRRKIWISEGDLILVGIWDFSPERGEVLYKYSKQETSKLLENNVVSKDFLDALSELI